MNLRKKTYINLYDIWKASIFIYIVCYTAFAFSEELTRINNIALYLFLFISFLAIVSLKHIRLNGYVISMFIFLIVLFIGFLISTSQWAFDYFYTFFVCLIIVLILTNFIETRNDIVYILKALMIGGVVQNFYIFLYYGIDIFSTISDTSRIGAVAGNLNEVGIRSCFSAILSLYFAVCEESKIMQKVGLFLISILCMFFAVITASKKVLILLFMGLVFLFFARRKKNINNKKSMIVFRLVIVILVILILLYFISKLSFFDSLMNRFNDLLNLLFKGQENSSDGKRLRYITQGFQVFLDNPIIGDGTGASYNYFGTYSHCNFIEILMNNGIVGFAVFYYVYVIIINKLLKLVKKSKDKLIPLCFFILCSIIVLSIALVYYNQIYYQIYIAIVASVAFSDFSRIKT